MQVIQGNETSEASLFHGLGFMHMAPRRRGPFSLVLDGLCSVH